MTDDVMYMSLPTKGIQVPVGKSKTIEVQLLSDAPTGGPWTVSAKVIAGGAPANALTFSFDRTSGTNGEKLHMTVTANQSGPIPFSITSMLGARQTYWAGLVAQ